MMPSMPEARTVRTMRHAAAIVVVAAVSACASRPSTVPGPATPASGDAGISLDARLLEMVDQRRADTALVDRLLDDADPVRRARATLAIGQVKIRARYPRLRQMLLDGDTAIAANAAYALGIGRDTAAVPALARALAGAPDPVAREAAWSLGEIGDPARSVISQALGEGIPNPRNAAPIALRRPAVRAAVVLAASRLRPAPVPLVLPWLRDEDAAVVRAAAYVVGRLRAPAGVRGVLAVQQHADEEVRQYVARALGRTVAGDLLGSDAREALRTLMRDSSERVRVNAVQSASTWGGALADELDARWRDAAANVRVALAEVYAEVAARDTTRWQRAWQADTLFAVRRLLLQHVRRAQLPLFNGVEAQWAVHPDWRVRQAALGSGERDAPRPDTALARSLLNDPELRVRRVARARLGLRDSTEVPRARSSSPQPRPLAEYERVVRTYWRAGAPRPRAYVDTDHGTITLELFGAEAPLVVESFVKLAQQGRYRNTTFHRVVPNFVVQDGDISAENNGDVGFSLRESWTRQRHGRGCLGLATAGPDTGGSQYYLCHSTQPHLDGGYTVFGRVVDGFDVMDRIVQGDRMVQVRVP